MMIKISKSFCKLDYFLLFHIQGCGMQVLLNPLEILVKELFFTKTSALLTANAIKKFNK